MVVCILRATHPTSASVKSSRSPGPSRNFPAMHTLAQLEMCVQRMLFTKV